MKDILISLNKAVTAEMSESGTANILCASEQQMQTAESERILRLCFQDITDGRCSDAFQKEHAKQIVSFFERIAGKEDIDCVFVCCDAGISRSPAIAAALMREQGQNDDCIWSDAEYDPNPLVYRRLCHAFRHPVTSSELRKKLRLNRIAWHKKIFNDLCEGLKEIIAYERGEIPLRVTAFDEEDTHHTEKKEVVFHFLLLRWYYEHHGNIRIVRIPLCDAALS